MVVKFLYNMYNPSNFNTEYLCIYTNIEKCSHQPSTNKFSTCIGTIFFFFKLTCVMLRPTKTEFRKPSLSIEHVFYFYRIHFYTVATVLPETLSNLI